MDNKMIANLWVLFFIVLSTPAHAVYFSSYIYEMASDENFISKAVTNDTEQINSYKISAFKIDRPGETGENQMLQEQRELIFTPLKLTIPEKKTDYFKLLYIGPKDAQERYYRVVFLENKINAYDKENIQDASTQFLPSVSLSTILIVRPRQQNLKYDLDEQQGYLKNTGNTFFRVAILQGCNGTDEDSQQFYMLPGEEYRDQSLIGENKKYIIANKKYIPIGQKCAEKLD